MKLLWLRNVRKLYKIYVKILVWIEQVIFQTRTVFHRLANSNSQSGIDGSCKPGQLLIPLASIPRVAPEWQMFTTAV